MRIISIIAVTLALLQSLACANGSNCSDIELKLHVIKPDSKSPRYELIFYRCGKKIARRIYYKGKTILAVGEIPDGKVVERYDDGGIKNIFIYKNGKKNGKVLSFYKSGRLKAEGIYRDDSPVGKGKMYYENGKIKAEWKIVHGKEVYHREYYENGQLKKGEYNECDKGVLNDGK